MDSTLFKIWGTLPTRERILTCLVLALLWGGVCVSVGLFVLSATTDPGSFFWGGIAGSIVLAYLAFIKKKKDIVSLLTPVYAVIIFTGLEIPSNILLQVLFAASLTILVVRLHIRFS